MTVYFNNSQINTEATELGTLLGEHQLIDKKGIAVAVNEEVIPRALWTETPLNENDKILVITATQGG